MIYDYMPLAKIELDYNANTQELKYQVLEMNESLRDKGLIFTAPNRWEINSGGQPDINLGTNRIWLRGRNRGYDLGLITYSNVTSSTFDDILEAFNEWYNDYTANNTKASAHKFEVKSPEALEVKIVKYCTNHEWVDVGFCFPKFVCKHCDKDKAEVDAIEARVKKVFG